MFSSMLTNLSMTSALRGTQLIRHGGLSKADPTIHTGLFSRWRFKRKFLQEAGEEKEHFYTSQVLARTHPFTYKIQASKDIDFYKFSSLVT